MIHQEAVVGLIICMRTYIIIDVVFCDVLFVCDSAVDCIMADDWQPWSACSSRCGLGTRRRVRRVVRTASNGGRPCSSSVQKGICYGTGCKFARAHGRVQMQGIVHGPLIYLVRSTDNSDKTITVHVVIAIIRRP